MKRLILVSMLAVGCVSQRYFDLRDSVAEAELRVEQATTPLEVAKAAAILQQRQAELDAYNRATERPAVYVMPAQP